MAEHSYFTLDVFTDRIFGGNPLAVFPDASGFDTAQMQAAARELNLSETVFVLPPDNPAHTRRLRIFTPATELPFAGHPTIGTAHLLATTGDVPLVDQNAAIVFEEAVGPVPVTVSAEGGEPMAAQLSIANLPAFGPQVPTRSELAEVLSLGVEDLAESPSPAAVSCGVPFVFVMLNSLDALARATLYRDAWARLLAQEWAPHLYLVTPVGTDRTELRARMFAPAMGIDEDPATGAAAAALAGFLASTEERSETALQISVQQGVEMGRPSRIEVGADLAAGEVTGVRVAGQSVLVARGRMSIPPATPNVAAACTSAVGADACGSA